MRERIRHILKEETKLPAFIRRRVPSDEIEKEFEESLESAMSMYSRRLNSSDYNFTYEQGLEHLIWVTISMLIDSIHHHLYSTLPEDIRWWDEVFEMLEKHYRSRIVKAYMKKYKI